MADSPVVEPRPGRAVTASASGPTTRTGPDRPAVAAGSYVTGSVDPAVAAVAGEGSGDSG
jgi:hypothetical protein